MKVTKWVNWEHCNDYIDIDDIPYIDFLEIENAVINEVKEKGYKFSGQYHQNGAFGCPVVDDKYVYAVSMRKWGGIIQRAYNLPNEDGLGYCLWAWGHPTDEIEVYPME